MGRPFGELDTMPEADLRLYQVYAAKRMLPVRRMEMHLAQLTRAVYQSVGNKEVTTFDFLFDVENVGDEPASAEEARDFFEFKPVE